VVAVLAGIVAPVAAKLQAMEPGVAPEARCGGQNLEEVVVVAAPMGVVTFLAVIRAVVMAVTGAAAPTGHLLLLMADNLHLITPQMGIYHFLYR
jgi:hypothetical protein